MSFPDTIQFSLQIYKTFRKAHMCEGKISLTYIKGKIPRVNNNFTELKFELSKTQRLLPFAVGV